MRGQRSTDRRRVQGGAKSDAAFVSPDPSSIVILGGSTGVGKTVVIQSDANAIDLEGYANHRGSAFGAHLSSQPSQIDFENAVALEFFKQQPPGSLSGDKCPTLLEDEGRMIGRIHLPPPLQAAMQQAPMIILEAKLESRMSRIFEEYVVEHLDEIRGTGLPADPFHVLEERLGNSLLAIRKRLGGAGYAAISEQLRTAIKAHRDGDASGHQDWIKTLLLDYYDPMYAYQLEKKQHRVVFRLLPRK